MNWKFFFGFLFVAFVGLTVIYANKSLTLYDKVTVEDIRETSKDENGASSVYSHPQKVTRTYQDNYASIGGAIGFGIIAAASLLAFAITIKNEKT
jgi:hypothetical protein